MKTLGVIFSNIHDDNIPELTAKRTLSSVPFAGRFRLIDFVLSNMVNGNINKVGVITKYNYQSLMDHIGSGKQWDLSRKNGGLMVLPPFGSQGTKVYSSRFEALQNIGQFLHRSDEEYVVMSDCDTVYSIDFNDVLQYHIDKHADITIVYRNQQLDGSINDISTIEVYDDNRVFSVNNANRQTGMKKVYTNILILNRKFLLNLLESSKELGYNSFSNDVLGKGCRGYKVFAYEHKGYFAWINSLTSYFNCSMELLNKQMRDQLFYNEGANVFTKVRDSAPCRLEPGAKVSNSIIADGCVIQGQVKNSILFRGVYVGPGAVVKDSIVFQDTAIGKNSKLNCVIADKQAQVLDGRELSGHCTHPYFISKNSII